MSNKRTHIFAVWIDEPRWRGNHDGRLLCDVLRSVPMMEFEWTDEEFTQHADALDRAGFSIREHSAEPIPVAPVVGGEV